MGSAHLIAAIDGSEHSEAVLEKAIEFARVLNARIILVHCHHKFPAVLGQPDNERQISAIITEAERLIKPFTERLAEAGIDFEERLLEEPAGEAIANAARIEKVDLIVMGSRGLTNLASLIVGSVTNRVLQIAPCPVLVIR